MKTTSKKNLFLIPLKFRGKPFLGLAQLSKIFIVYFQMQYFDKYRFSLTNIVGEFNVAVASRMEKMPPWTHKEEDTS